MSGKTIRTCLTSGLLVLLLAAPAPAAVTPLAPVSGEASVAIAGDRVLVFETLESGVRVRSVPAGGGPERVVFEAASAPGDLLRIAGWASAERAAFVVIHERAFEEEFLRELYVGPPGGPFDVVASGEWGRTPVPATAAVSGTTAFWGNWGPDFSEGYRWMAEAPGAPRAIPSPGDAVGLDFAGDLAGGPVYTDGTGAQRYVVFDHRTGEQRLGFDVIEPDTHALRSDGTAVVEDEDLLLASPARPRPRRLPGAMDVLGFAGHRVVGVRSGPRGESLRALPLDGRRSRRVGPATRAVGAVAAEEAGRVAWVANGCVVIARASDRPVRSLPAGPCARAETTVDPRVRGDVVLGRRKALPLRLRCVAAPGSCAGRVELVPGSRRRFFRVRVGRSENVRVPVSEEARRYLRDEFGDGGGSALIEARATAIDPAGRTTVSSVFLLVFRDVAARRRHG